jgi:hypothetical protein
MRVHKARAVKKQGKVDVSDIQAAGEFVQTASVFRRPLSAAERQAQPQQDQQNQQPEQPVDVSNQQVASDICTQASGLGDTPPDKTQKSTANSTYIFQDEGLNTFFRRLSFSPEGSFVVAPAATLGPLAPAPKCDDPRTIDWNPFQM